MTRVLAFLYGLAAYVAFLVTFVYAVGFVGGFAVPKTIDSGTAGSVLTAVLVNLALLGLFGMQHSVMARQGFKKWWTRIIPKPVERSTYVLLASLTLAAVFYFWQPLPAVVWSVEAEPARLALWTLFGAGWFVVLSGSYMIDHFDLVGLAQVWAHLKGEEYTYPEFQTTGYYDKVRHPLMLGFVVAFWATPEMTVGHLLFAAASTGYILVGIHFEEKDLVDYHGEAYRRYRRTTPMLIPGLGGRAKAEDREGRAPDAGPETSPGV